MRYRRFDLALTGLVLAGAAGLSGCAGMAAGTCTVTPYITPASVTLDHSNTSGGNAAAFSAGYTYSGSSCVISNVLPLYYFSVSDPKVATTTGSNVVSCLAASTEPVTVTAVLMGTNAQNQPVVIDPGLPRAQLTCK